MGLPSGGVLAWLGGQEGGREEGKVVWLDWPVGASADRGAFFDDAGDTPHVSNGDELLPVGEESSPLPKGGAGRIGGACDEIAAGGMDVAAVFDSDWAELVALVVDELLPVVDLVGRTHVCGVTRGGRREGDRGGLGHDAGDVVDEEVRAGSAAEDDDVRTFVGSGQ